MVQKVDLSFKELTLNTVEVEGYAIPKNLGHVTERLIEAHKQNGDMHWLLDVVTQSMEEEFNVPTEGN